MASSKTGPKVSTIDEYIAASPKEVRSLLEQVRQVIKETAPDAQEAISYGIPTFKLNGNLVHFAAFKKHLGFYPGGPSAIEAFKDELDGYQLSKGTIRFSLDEEIPFELVKRIVEFRVKENTSQKKQ